MNHQPKLLAIVVAIFALTIFTGLQAQSNCQPDTNLDSLGVFPSIPPTATVGEPYTTVLNAAIPKELTVPFGQGTITLDICTAQIVGADTSLVNRDTSLTDLGLTYDCNVPDCLITIDHSEADSFAFACIEVTGTPTAPFDSIDVLFEVGLGNYNAGTNTCITNLSLDTSLVVQLAASTTSNLLRESVGIELTSYFQPTQEELVVKLEGEGLGVYQLEVVDIRGIVVAGSSGEARGTFSEERFSTENWANGLYFIRLKDERGTEWSKKTLLRR